MNLVFKENIIISKNSIKALYDDVGWSAYTDDIKSLVKGLKNSLKVITVWDNKDLVGLIRVIGDKNTIIYIQDVLVKKSYQGKGIGSVLVEKVLASYKGVRQIVLLTDDKEENIRFYQKLGFASQDKFSCISFVKFNN